MRDRSIDYLGKNQDKATRDWAPHNLNLRLFTIRAKYAKVVDLRATGEILVLAPTTGNSLVGYDESRTALQGLSHCCGSQHSAKHALTAIIQRV